MIDHIKITPATRKDAEALSQLTIRSKAHWGYSAEQMEAWREELTITQDYISQNHVFILKGQQQVRGYYSFIEQSNSLVLLDNLFVDPDFMGQGLGGLLMADFLRRSKESNFSRIILEADPHAAGFYEKYGFRTVNQRVTAIPGRYLPVMALQLWS